MTFFRACFSVLTPLILFGLFVLGCGESAQHRPLNEAQVREQLMQYNRSRVAEEDTLIERFMRRHELDFLRSPTGMRYSIDHQVVGPQLVTGDFVAINFRIYLLDSTLCYDNIGASRVSMVVNGSDMAAGFHELVPIVGRGGVARSIWPARLGYGVAGDLNRIPPEAILLVDLEVQ